jgi:hypothetical protein
MKAMPHRLTRFGMVACFMVGCGGSTEPGGTNVHEDGGQDVTSAPDPACLAFCASHDLACLGADTEYGTGTVTVVTAKGCSVEVMLVVTGTIDLTVDCTSKSVCVDRAPGECTGTAGMCYPARELTAMGFAYSLPGCIHGSLGCSVRD